ncbi:helix-turn-helix domain-containing protein [Nonomuraea gerenzanensis]|nr:XRE family transcriptional regulator [Nonomuraea gerenzanensis]UBU08367.1 XRE family transcriptional regulator [Nonomuraea gerenzanensis]
MTSSAHQEAPVAGSPGLEQEIGATIREARRRAGITMTALASATGLSQAFLSHLETGRSAPSVATLYRLAQALNVLPQDLLPRPSGRDLVITRRGDGPRLTGTERGGAGGDFRLLAGEPDGLIKANEVTAMPNTPAGDWFEHPGEDLVVVIGGTLRIEFRDWQAVQLNDGDSIWYKGLQPHRWSFPSEQPTRLFLVTAQHRQDHP